MKKSILITGILLVSICTYSQSFIEEMSNDGIEVSSLDLTTLNNLSSSNHIQEHHLIKVGNLKNLYKAGAIPIRLPGHNRKFVAFTRRIEYQSEDDYLWEGEFKNVEGTITIISKQGQKYGNIFLADEKYQIWTLDSKAAVLVKLMPINLQELTCGAVDNGISKTEYSSQKDVRRIPDYANVRILILLTPNADNQIVNRNDYADLLLQQMNSALVNSDIGDVVTTLAGVEVLNGFVETTNIFEDMDELRVMSIGRRNALDADVVLMIADADYVDANSQLGIAGAVIEVGPSDADAYGIVTMDAAFSRYTFAHEFGHFFGARHNPEVDMNPPAWAHGYAFSTGVWPFRTHRGTLLSVFNVSNRVLNFSNPDVNYQGKSTGTTAEHDNARQIENEGNTVEDFRQSADPFITSLSGPSSANEGDLLMFTASSFQGTSPYSYQWWVSTDGIGYVYKGTGTSMSHTMPSTNLYVRLNSSDAGGMSDVDYSTVTNNGPQCKRPKDCDLDPIVVIKDESVDDEAATNIKLNVYPNPTENVLTISNSASERIESSISILDLSGNVIIDLGTQYFDYKETRIFDNDLEPGIYIIRIIQEGNDKTIRFIKN